jgi:hypothetical protein
MTPDSPDLLARSLEAFQVRRLGDGDAVAGANNLVAMAALLTAAAPPGSRVSSPGSSKSRPLGIDLLVTGSYSCSVVLEDAVSALRERQENIAIHVRHEQQRRDQWEAKMAKGATGMGDAPWNKPQSGLAESAMEGACADPFHSPFSSKEAMRDVIKRRAPRSFSDLAARHSVLITATRAAELEKRLQGAHGNEALALMGIQRKGDLAAFGEVAEALMDGRVSQDDRTGTIKGHVLVTDPGRLIGTSGEKTRDSVAWLDRCIWLADGNFGVELPKRISVPAEARMDRVEGRFRSALVTLLTWRFNLHGGNPCTIDVNADPKAHHRWIAFLRELEPKWPGIAGTARNLLSTLHFGLAMMSTHAEGLRPFSIRPGEVEAFARYIVIRMVAARSTMLFATRNERQERHRKAICRQLERHPRSDRELYRNTSLSAGECTGALSDLQREGIVIRDGNRWRLSDQPERQLSLDA